VTSAIATAHVAAPSAPAVAGCPESIEPSALHGVLGDLVGVLGPNTEACTEALLFQALVMFGSAIGRGPYYLAEADRHFGNLYVVLVGSTSKGRKGSSFGRLRHVFEGVEPAWVKDCVQSGLSSGEGLIHAVRDPGAAPAAHRESRGTERVPDPGVTDKRLLLMESEWAGVLRVLSRDGNTLSAIIRQAWDTGALCSLVKNSPSRATGAHVSLIGHITADELRRYLSTTEAGNGLANRHLFACVRRAHVLPFGGEVHDKDLRPIVVRLREAVSYARGLGERRIEMAEGARHLWRSVYEGLSEGQLGLLGAVTSRAEAQAVRLAMLYALLDRSETIQREHLAAALAVWDYALRSARHIFGAALGDPLADELLRLLRQAGEGGMTRSEIRDALGRHGRGLEIGRALALLRARGLANQSERATEGRPAEVWRASRSRATEATNEAKVVVGVPPAKPSVASVALREERSQR